MHHSHYITFCNALWPTRSAPRERVGLELGGCLHIWLSPLALCCTGRAISFLLRINGQRLNELYVLLNFCPNVGLWYHTTLCSNLMNNHNLQVLDFTKHILLLCALSCSRGSFSHLMKICDSDYNYTHATYQWTLSVIRWYLAESKP